MKILKLSSLIILIGIIISCTGKSVKKDEVVEKSYKYASMKDGILHLDLLNATKDSCVLKLSQIADSLIYIPLETTEKCLLKNYINELYIDGDDIFLQDGWCVYNFDISGKFKRQIGKVGRGPGEFICTGMTINKDLKRVYINANFKHRLYEYDYNGRFISDKVVIKSSDEEMYFCAHDNLMYYTSLYCLHLKRKELTTYNPVNIYDINGKLVKEYKSKYFPDIFFNGDVGGRVVMTGAQIYEYNNSMYFHELANDTLFSVNKDTIIPRLILNDSDNTNNYFNSQSLAERMRLAKKGALNAHESWMSMPKSVTGESDRFIFIDGMAKPPYVYDKQERTLFCSEEYVQFEEGDKPVEKKTIRYTYENDMDGVNHMSSNMVINNKYIVRVINAVDFMDNIEKLKLQKNTDTKYLARLVEIAKSLEEESNPVMILARLKK